MAVAASADYLITHSSYTTGELRQLGMQKILEYPLFVDTARFGGEDPELAGLLAQASYLLFVGRIVPPEGYSLPAGDICSRPTRFPALADPGGRARPVPGYQVALEEFIKSRGLAGRVLFTGQINNPAVLAALYRHARLVVIASKWESFCVPVAESLYFGTPVAVNNIPPLPEVAGEAGLVFDSAEPEVAASRIVSLLEDEGAYATLQEAAGKQAVRYSGPALALNVRRLLELIAGDTQLSAPQGITAGTP